jgi:hypothetical protein
MMHQLFMTAAADQPMDWGAYGRLLPHTWRFSHAKIVTPCKAATRNISYRELTAIYLFRLPADLFSVVISGASGMQRNIA